MRLARILPALLLLVAGRALAAPVVSGITGTVATGSSIQISGTLFGTKATAAPLVWDNFESGTDGSDLAGWSLSSGYHPVYSTTQHWGDGKSARLTLTQDSNVNEARKNITGSTEIYASYNFYLVANGGRHTKMLRITKGQDVHGTPRMGYTAGPSYAYVFTGAGEGLEDSLNNLPNDGPEDPAWPHYGASESTWHRDEYWLRLSAPDVADGFAVAWRDGTRKTPNTPIVTHKAADDGSVIDWIFLPYFAQDASRTLYVDNVYIDNTRARVEICDQSTYPTGSLAAHCEIQVTSAWSATSITVTVNRGSFASPSNAWLYVIDSNGVASNGRGLTFGSGVAVGPVTYYVSPAGNNNCDGLVTTAYSPGVTHCAWKDPSKCIASMAAGDTCEMLTGTYTCPAPLGAFSTDVPCFNVCDGKSGLTAAAPTIYKRYGSDAPKFCVDSSCSAIGNGNGALFGAAAGFSELVGGVQKVPAGPCQNIAINGVAVDGGFVVKGEPWAGKCPNGTTDCRHNGDCGGLACADAGGFTAVKNITVTQGYFEGGNGCDGDYSPVRISNASGITLSNNYLTGITEGACTSLTNAALLKVGSVYDSTFDHNHMMQGSGRAGYAVDINGSSVRNTFSHAVSDQYWRLGGPVGAGYSANNTFFHDAWKGFVEATRSDATVIDSCGFTGGDFISAADTSQCPQDPTYQGGRYFGSATNEFRNNFFLPGAARHSVFGKDTWTNISGWKFDHNNYDTSHTWQANKNSHPLSCGTTDTFSNTTVGGTTTTIAAPCSTVNVASRTHSWTASADGTATAVMCGAFDTQIAIRDGNGAQITCDDDSATTCGNGRTDNSRVTWTVIGGTTYDIVATKTSASSGGAYTLTVNGPGAAGACCDTSTDPAAVSALNTWKSSLTSSGISSGNAESSSSTGCTVAVPLLFDAFAQLYDITSGPCLTGASDGGEVGPYGGGVTCIGSGCGEGQPPTVTTSTILTPVSGADVSPTVGAGCPTNYRPKVIGPDGHTFSCNLNGGLWKWADITPAGGGSAPGGNATNVQIKASAGGLGGDDSLKHDTTTKETFAQILNATNNPAMAAGVTGLGTAASPWMGWESSFAALVSAGKDVLIPEGTFYTTAGVTLTGAKVAIRGVGADKSIIRCAGVGPCAKIENGFKSRVDLSDFALYITAQVTNGVCALDGTTACVSTQVTSALAPDATCTGLGNYCLRSVLDIGSEGTSAAAIDGMAINNVQVSFDTTAHAEGVTAIKVTNANDGVISGIKVTGDSGQNAGWAMGLDLFPHEQQNRGNIQVMGGDFTKIHNCVRLGYRSAIVNSNTIVGTKCVSNISAASAPTRSDVGFDIYGGADLTEMAGTQSEAFGRGIVLHPSRGSLSVTGHWFGHVAGPGTGGAAGPDGIGVDVIRGYCFGTSSTIECNMDSECASVGSAPHTCTAAVYDGPLIITNSRFDLPDTTGACGGQCGIGVRIGTPNITPYIFGNKQRGNTLRIFHAHDPHCSVSTTMSCNGNADCPGETCNSTSVSYDEGILLDGEGYIALPRDATSSRTGSIGKYVRGGVGSADVDLIGAQILGACSVTTSQTCLRHCSVTTSRTCDFSTLCPTGEACLNNSGFDVGQCPVGQACVGFRPSSAMKLSGGDPNGFRILDNFGNVRMQIRPGPAQGNIANKMPVDFTATTSVTIATGSLTRGNVTCYDSVSHDVVEPDNVDWDPSTGLVTVTFLTSRSGTCVATY